MGMVGSGGGGSSNTYEYLHNFPFLWQYRWGSTDPFDEGQVTGELDFLLLASGGLYYDKN
jgi:hypothetical protein